MRQKYEVLLALLFEMDPMRLNFGGNVDEYSPEVRTILKRLPECSSPEDLSRVMVEEFKSWFSPLTVVESRFPAIAERAWPLLNS